MRKNLKFGLEIESNALLCPNPSEFYSKTYITEDIVDNFRTLPGIKYATKLAKNDFVSILKPSTCDFPATTGETLDAIDIDVVSLSAFGEICKFDLEQSFVSLKMAKGSAGNWQVADFMAHYWDTMSAEIHSEISVLRWKGNTAGTGGGYTGVNAYLTGADGYEKKLAADAGVIDVTAITVTAANVIAEMNKVYLALPAALQSKIADLRFYVSSNVAAAYRIAAALGNTNVYITEAQKLTYLGIKIVEEEGMSANRMVLTVKPNMIYAFDGEGDGENIEAIDLSKSVAEPKLRSRVDLKVGFYFVNPTEIVYYNA